MSYQFADDQNYTKCNVILVCPREDGWGSKTVAQSHTTLTSPVTMRIKISVWEEETTSLIVPHCKTHSYYTDPIVKLFNNVRN